VKLLREISSLSSGLYDLGEPGSALALFPLSLAFCSLFVRIENTHAVLDVELPLTDILVAIRELHRALPVLFAAFELPVVAAAVLELKFACTLEHVLLELPFVSLLALREVVHSCTNQTVRLHNHCRKVRLPSPQNMLSTKSPS
jgi:hypothetical protein